MKKVLGGLLVSSSLAVLASAPAMAQTQSFEADADQVSEPENSRGNVIVVTAQKREQTLMDVPASVTVLGGDELTKRNVATLDAAQYAVPGLSITEFAPGTQRIQLRGVSVFGGLPTVGVYFDEVPLNTEANQQGQDVRFLDIERIEVLRGPQGTLYGQGSVGGTIRYLSNPVNLADYEIAGSAEVGLINGGGTDWVLTGVANLPIAEDKAGLRLAARYDRFGGWIDNPILGEENTNSGDALTLRAKFAAALSENTDFTVLIQHQTLDLNAQNQSNANQESLFVVPTPLSNETTFGSLVIEHDFGGISLLSATGYLDRNASGVTDFTAFLVPALEAPPPFGFGFPAGTFNGVAVSQLVNNEIFTQELRLSSSGEGSFNWTAGAFYRDSRSSDTTLTDVDPDIVPVPLIEIRGTGPADSESWAIFGEVSYKFTNELTALIGARYFEDRRVQDLRSVTFGAPAVDQNSAKFDDFSPRFNLSWQPSADLTIFVNASKGFRSGGFNNTSAGLGVFDVPPTFEPDVLWSYEGGARMQSADGRIQAEATVYRNEWSNVQSQAFLPNSPIVITANTGDLAGWGAEGALTFSPAPGFSFGGTAGWNDMTYQTDTAEHNAGDPADYVPRFTASVFAEYNFAVGTGDSFVRIDYQYSDEFQIFLRNTQIAPAFSDQQDLINLTAGLNFENLSFNLFARNILNEDSIIYPALGAIPVPTRRQPRVLGASIGFNF